MNMNLYLTYEHKLFHRRMWKQLYLQQRCITKPNTFQRRSPLIILCALCIYTECVCAMLLNVEFTHLWNALRVWI